MAQMRKFMLKFSFVIYMSVMFLLVSAVAFQTVHAFGNDAGLGERVRASEVSVQQLLDEHLNQRLTVVETQLTTLLKLLWLILAALVGKTIHDHFNLGRMRASLHKVNNISSEYLLTAAALQKGHEELVKKLEADLEASQRLAAALATKIQTKTTGI